MLKKTMLSAEVRPTDLPDAQEALSVMRRQTDALDNVHLYMLQLNTLMQAMAEQTQRLGQEIASLQLRLERVEGTLR